MVPILLIFLTVNEHIGQLLLVGPNALWHWTTQPKFWAGHGPRCSAPHVYASV